MKTDTNSNAARETTQGIPQSREAGAGPSAKTVGRARRVRATKPRSDSTLEGLSRERKEQLAEWLVDENRGYAEVRELVAREWGVRTSRSALGSYFRQRLVPQQIAEATEAAEGVGGPPSPSLRRAGPCSPGLRRAGPCSPRLRRGHDLFGEAARRRASQLGFMALMERVPDGKAARLFLGIVDDFEKRELARERLALRERLVKLRERKETPPPEPPRLTYQEKVEKACAVFGVEPAVYHERVRREEEAAEQTRKAEGGTRNEQTGSDQTRSAEGGAGSDQTGSAELGTRSEAAVQSGASESAIARIDESATRVAKTEAAGFGDPALHGNESAGGVGVGPGVPGSFRVGRADPAVFSAAERGALSEPRINANGHESTAAGAKGQTSEQPRITRMGAGSQTGDGGPGTGTGQSRSAEGGTGMDAPEGGGETASLSRSAELGTRADAPEGRSKTAPLQGTVGTQVGSAAGCRSHGGFGATEVTYGRVLGAEGGMRAAGGSAGFGDPAPCHLQRGGETQSGRSETAPLQGSAVSVRGVVNWQGGGLAVFGGSLPVWPRPEAVY